MNNLKNVFNRVRASVPKGGAAGAAPGGGPAPNVAGPLGFLVFVGVGSWAVYHSMVTVQPGHKGVVYNRLGGLDENHVLKEGLNFVVPWFQRPVVYDIRTRPAPVDSHSGSKDLQMVTISLRVLFKPDPNALGFMYRRLGMGMLCLILRSYSQLNVDLHSLKQISISGYSPQSSTK
jgi:regulator of protease activity HflC (stomatin/prohibitin superfamily)